MKNIFDIAANATISIIALVIVGQIIFSCIMTFKSKNHEVELLFKHDGVKVYRFYDGGRYNYYTDSRNSGLTTAEFFGKDVPEFIK